MRAVVLVILQKKVMPVLNIINGVMNYSLARLALEARAYLRANANSIANLDARNLRADLCCNTCNLITSLL